MSYKDVILQHFLVTVHSARLDMSCCTGAGHWRVVTSKWVIDPNVIMKHQLLPVCNCTGAVHYSIRFIKYFWTIILFYFFVSYDDTLWLCLSLFQLENKWHWCVASFSSCLILKLFHAQVLRYNGPIKSYSYDPPTACSLADKTIQVTHLWYLLLFVIAAINIFLQLKHVSE